MSESEGAASRTDAMAGMGAVHRGRIFHVRHKPLYAAIGEPNNRKSMPVGRMVDRVIALDAVVADRSFTWLGTEKDEGRALQARVSWTSRGS